MRLLCRSSCSCLVNSRKFSSLLLWGSLFLWCTTKVLGRCFWPVLSDLKPLRFISSCFSSSDNKPICPPPCLGSDDYSITTSNVNIHLLSNRRWWRRIRVCGNDYGFALNPDGMLFVAFMAEGDLSWA